LNFKEWENRRRKKMKLGRKIDGKEMTGREGERKKYERILISKKRINILHQI
jgi:hypothetical protein